MLRHLRRLLQLADWIVLVQPEMEKQRFPLAWIPYPRDGIFKPRVSYTGLHFS